MGRSRQSSKAKNKRAPKPKGHTTQPPSGGKYPKKRAVSKKKVISGLNSLRSINNHCRDLTIDGSNPGIRTCIDNGAEQCLIGCLDWIITKRHHIWITCVSALGGQPAEVLRQVDAHTALVNDQGKSIAILVVNHAIHCDKSE